MIDIGIPFYTFILEIILIFVIWKLTDKKLTYESIATNGIITTMAAGTLLFDKKPLGFILLAYAAFLLTAGVRAHEDRKFGMEDKFSKTLKIFGNYITVSIVLVIVLIIEYILPIFLG